MQFYNSLTREKDPLVPVKAGEVSMYVCGPTVYSYAHIGNARPAVVFDVLARLLRKRFDKVTYVRNITDIEDKINAAAVAEGVPISEITERFTAIYHEDLAKLHVLPPDIEPRVTGHLPEIIEQIEQLIERGHAYEAEGHVLFNVPSFDDYGSLSGRDRREMIAGARVEVAPYKKDPADFVLWKPSDDETPGWDSPWGRGRPGWHIECSAMSMTHLGAPFDIHGGGHDLIFPHHENEIAQGSCSGDHGSYCNHWMHNGFVTVEGQKMSKSIGNVLLVHDIVADHPGEVARLALLLAHYRQPMDWNERLLEQSRKMLDRLYEALRRLDDSAEDDAAGRELAAGVFAALEDDLNTPQALTEMMALAKAANKDDQPEQKPALKSALKQGAAVLGLLNETPQQWFESAGAASTDNGLAPEQIDALLLERNQARADKNFARADEIRDQLAAGNIIIEDSAEGSRWKRI